MIEPIAKDQTLLQQIQNTNTTNRLAVWWLGQSGFLIKQDGRYLLFDPYLSDSLTRKYADTDKPHVRMTENPVDPGTLDFLDAVTSTHNHTDHLDAETLGPILQANPTTAVIVAEANREFAAQRLGLESAKLIGLTSDQSKTVGGFEIVGVPAAHEDLERDEAGHPRFMGFIAKRNGWCVYHSGDTMWFDQLPGHVQPHQPDLALLPINGKRPERRVAGNLNGEEAAQLGSSIGAGLVVPCHFEMFTFNTEPPDLFEQTCTKLGQPYRVMRCGQRLMLPDDVASSNRSI
jgi:L-ascorbate metabolism protein UlaG (beta-lactamase superfamily)